MQNTWIALQVGLSESKVFILSSEGEVLAQHQRQLAADQLDSAQICALLAKIYSGEAPVDVVICGAVPKLHPLRKVPCKPFGTEAAEAITSPDPKFRLWHASGLYQEQPFDILASETITLAGLLAVHPKFDGVCVSCNPQRSSWSHVSAEEVISWRSFNSYELWHKLTKSLLFFNYDSPDFRESLAKTLSRPERLASEISSLNAQVFVAVLPQEAADLQLLALLIGAELAASKIYWLGQDITLIGEANLAKAYQAALAIQGINAKILPPDTCAIAGFKVLRQSIG